MLERLVQAVDPIDYTFLAPLLHTSRAHEYQVTTHKSTRKRVL